MRFDVNEPFIKKSVKIQSSPESIAFRNGIFRYLHHYISIKKNIVAADITNQQYAEWNEIEKKIVERRLEHIIKTITYNSDPQKYKEDYNTLADNMFFNDFRGKERIIENLKFDGQQDIKKWTSILWETLNNYKENKKDSANFKEMDELINNFQFENNNPFISEWTDETLENAQNLHILAVAIFGRITYLKMLEGSAMFKNGVLIPLSLQRKILARNVIKNHLILKNLERFSFIEIQPNPRYHNDYTDYLLGSVIAGVKIAVKISGKTKYINAMNILDQTTWDSSNPSIADINKELLEKCEEKNREFKPITTNQYSGYLIETISSQYKNWKSDTSIEDKQRKAMTTILDKLMKVWDSQVGKKFNKDDKKDRFFKDKKEYYETIVRNRLDRILNQLGKKSAMRRQFKEALLYKKGFPTPLDFSLDPDPNQIDDIFVLHLTDEHFRHEMGPFYEDSQYLSGFIKITIGNQHKDVNTIKANLNYQKDEITDFIKIWRTLIAETAIRHGTVYLVPLKKDKNGFTQYKSYTDKLTQIIEQYKQTYKKVRKLSGDSGWNLDEYYWNSRFDAGYHMVFKIVQNQVDMEKMTINNLDLSLIMCLLLQGNSFAIVPHGEQDRFITLLDYYGGTFKVTEIVGGGERPTPEGIEYIGGYDDLIKDLENSLRELRKIQISYPQFYGNNKYNLPILKNFVDAWNSIFRI